MLRLMHAVPTVCADIPASPCPGGTFPTAIDIINGTIWPPHSTNRSIDKLLDGVLAPVADSMGAWAASNYSNYIQVGTLLCRWRSVC